MCANQLLPLSQRRSLGAFAWELLTDPAVDQDRQNQPTQLPQETAVLARPSLHRHGNVSVHPVIIVQAPADLPEPIAALFDSDEDSGNEADDEYSNSPTGDETSIQGYQSRFREHFDISASLEEIRRLIPRKIPDSEEDSTDTNPSDAEEDQPDYHKDPSDSEDDVQGSRDKYKDAQEDHSDAEDSFTDAQENLPESDNACNARGRSQYTLHAKGVNCNGRLPIEDPRFVDFNMEEHASQSTQPFLDPRRLGNKSLIHDYDEYDVVCMLHPTSPAAYKAVELVAQTAPQHILQNNDLSHVLEGDDNVPVQGTMQDNASGGFSQNHYEADDASPAATSGISAQDLALRLSSRVNDISRGWTFGRHPRKSDLLLCDFNQTSMVSSMHFRIYLNAKGVMLLEDHSMNGTWVDRVSLCRKKYDNEDIKTPIRRVIQQGSEICIMSMDHQKDGIRFLVGTPQRDDSGRWSRKLSEYLGIAAQMKRQKDTLEKAAVGGQGLMMPPTVARNPLRSGDREDTPLSANALQALAAGTERFSHGMHWKGDDTYNVVEYIGKGAFALVYKIVTKHDGEPFAAKELEKRRFMKDGILDQKIHNELLIMKDLCHPNIVRYVDHKEIPQYLYIIMEYVPHGDLTTFINTGAVMPEFLCQVMARQICSALDYLHKRNITHRDIKPDNILIASNDPFVVKLSDFGLSKVITNEETFLRTFCGTLLYCAPEVYPGYDRFKAGKRGKRRRDEPPPTTSPYKQSVDIWAFAAVLYHLLCGTPAWTGSAEYRGALMLETVMTVPVDWDRLRHAGVSEVAIQFLSRMLIIDPALRSTETECLRHSWLKTETGSWDDVEGLDDLEDVGSDAIQGLLAIQENEEEELDASQLSLNDRHAHQEIEDSDEELVSDVDELPDTREPKRFKDHHLAQGVSFPTVTYPYLPNMQGVQLRPESIHPTGNRLFGEIGASALRSSGVLGYDAHAALQMPMEGNRDGGASASDIHYTADNSVTSDELAQHPLQYPQALRGPNFTGSAPSLLGTEALVGQLNMASPESAVSGPSASTSAAPTTPKTRDPSPLSNVPVGSKRSTQEMSSQVEEATPKRTKSNASESPSQPAVEQSVQKSVSKSPSLKDAGKYKTSSAKSLTSPSKSRNNQVSGDKSSEKAKDKQSSKGSKDVGVLTDIANTEPTQGSNEGSWGSKNSTPALNAKDAAAFTKPLPRLGTLTPIQGSIYTPTIKLEKRMTTYGRDPGSDFQHKNGLDTRIPKCALDIVFWRPGIEAQLSENPDLDWTAFDDLYAIVSTRTSQFVIVNGVALKKGIGHWAFGKLHTGDIVTIFNPVGKEGKAAEFLKFKCEFHVGASKEARKEGGFVVEKEEEKFLLMQARKSREGSLSATSTIGNAAAPAANNSAAL